MGKRGEHWRGKSTIGDKTITSLTFTSDKLFWVIACVYCVRKSNSRGTHTESPNKNDLTFFLQIT